MNHTPEHGRGGTSGRILFSISFLMIFSAFYWNCFNVAEIRAFHKFDPHSECLVVGRLVQSRQEGILSYGGLPGFGYIEHLFPSGDRLFDFQCDSYLEDREFRGYWSYCSQIGGQAILLSLLDAAIPVSPRFKLALFRGITAALSAIMLALIVRWFLLEFGLAASLAVLFSIVMSQWLTYFGRNLWWSLWVFYLPLLGVIYFLRYQSTSIRRRPLLLAAVVGAAVFVKCVFNGYEYITTTLIMMVTPLVYYHLRDGLSARRLVVDGAVVVIASLLAVAISFLVLFFQIAAESSFQDAIDHIVHALERRTIGTGAELAVDKTGRTEILVQYFDGTFFDLHQRSWFDCGQFIHRNILQLRYWMLALIFALASISACCRSLHTGATGTRRKHLSLVGALWFSILAPLSWFVIFKGHSYVHFHLNYVVWQMPFTLFGLALVGIASVGLLTRLLGRTPGRIVGFSLLGAWAIFLIANMGIQPDRFTLTVPGSHASIQSAIDAAGPFTRIRVKPGQYRGPFDFRDKELILISTDGPADTVLFAKGGDAAVLIERGRSRFSKIEGFTIRATVGVLCRTSSPTIKGNVLQGDGGSGCGIRSLDGGSPFIVDNQISGFGSVGISCEGGAARIQFNTITGNFGGGIRLKGGTASLTGNRISRNRALRGGGVSIAGGATVMDGNLIFRCESEEGGGLFAADANIRLVGNTITRNRAPRGSGIMLHRSKATLTNTIVWMNSTSTPGEIECTESALDVDHSLIGGGWPGQDNLDLDPRFVDPATDDFHLRGDSPCLGRGAVIRSPPEQEDLAGARDFENDSRKTEGNPDIGADEFRPRLYRVGSKSGSPRIRIIGFPGSDIHICICRFRDQLGRFTDRDDVFQLGDPIQKIWIPPVPHSGYIEVPFGRPPGFSPKEILFMQAEVNYHWTNLLAWPGAPESLTDTDKPK